MKIQLIQKIAINVWENISMDEIKSVIDKLDETTKVLLIFLFVFNPRLEMEFNAIAMF
jgi:hypothetical protein